VKNVDGHYVMKSGSQSQFSFTGGQGADKATWSATGTHTGIFATDGTYTAPDVSVKETVTVTLTDKDFSNIKTTAYIDIYPSIAVSTAGNALAVARGATLQFSVAGGTGTYVWSVSGGGTIDANGLFTPAAGSGTQTITVTATDAVANYMTGVSQTITLMDPIVITSILPQKSGILYMLSGAATTFGFTGGRHGGLHGADGYVEADGDSDGDG